MPLQAPFRTGFGRSLSNPVIHVIFILLTGVLAYTNTFNVPFLFDDGRTIIENHAIKNIGNFWPPSGSRWFGSLTFAINYAFGGLQVSGYHYVNLAIHVAASFMVYRLVVLTFRTTYFEENEFAAISNEAACITAFAAAFLFVSHPIQTQAVTYISQRFASLATLLFLASTVCFIQARLFFIECDVCRLRRRIYYAVIWLSASVVLAVLAMKTKEIAFTLPVVIVMYECSFISGRKLSERLLFLVPLVLTLFVIPLALLTVGTEGVSVPSAAADISRHDYLLTQFRVIVTYLRLLILPVNQMIDYVYPVSRELSSPPVFLSLALLVTLFLTSTLLLFCGRKWGKSGVLRLAGFGGLWFFITLSVESSIIPITDVIFEHRVYLPSAGIFMAVAAIGLFVVEHLGIGSSRWAIRMGILIVCILMVLPLMTYFRNEVWQSHLSIWEDVAKKAPDNARARAIIGIKLVETGKTDQAIERFKEAIRIKPDYADAIICLGNAYIAKGLLDEGYQQYLKALVLGNIDVESRAQLMMNLGNYNFKVGLYDRAIYYYLSSLAIMPDVATAHYNLGKAYRAKGMEDLAVGELARARQLNPDRY